MTEVGDLLLGRLSQWVGAATDNLDEIREEERGGGEEGREEGKAGSKQGKWRKKGVGMWREDGGMEVWVDGWSE